MPPWCGRRLVRVEREPERSSPHSPVAGDSGPMLLLGDVESHPCVSTLCRLQAGTQRGGWEWEKLGALGLSLLFLFLCPCWQPSEPTEERLSRPCRRACQVPPRGLSRSRRCRTLRLPFQRPNPSRGRCRLPCPSSGPGGPLFPLCPQLTMRPQ